MSDPIQPTLIIIAYLLFVYYGPKWMEKRNPMRLQEILVVYNFSMVLFSAYILHEVDQCFIVLESLFVLLCKFVPRDIINFYSQLMKHICLYKNWFIYYFDSQ